MLTNLMCAMTNHRVERKRVWHDRLNLRNNCSHCGTVMIRTINGWRAYDPETDFHEERLEEEPLRVRQNELT